MLSAESTFAFLTTTPAWAWDTRSKFQLSPDHHVVARSGILSNDAVVFHSKKSFILQVASKPMQDLSLKEASRPIDSVEQEEANLLQSLQNYKNLEESSTKPSVDDFVSLIELWLKYPSPDRAEVILDNMEELYTPSGRIYERIINAWSFAASECIEKMRLMSRDEEPGIIYDEKYEEKRAKEIGELRGNALMSLSLNKASRPIDDSVEQEEATLLQSLQNYKNLEESSTNHQWMTLCHLSSCG